MRYTFTTIILCQILLGATSFAESFIPNFNNVPLWETPLPHNITEKEVKVGLLAPLSGKNKNIGQSILNAALVAIYKSPQSEITLVPIDSGTTEEDAVQAAKIAIESGCETILGPVFSKQVSVIKGLLPKNINIISFSNDVTNASDNTFIAGYSPHEQTEFTLEFLYKQGADRIAALLPNNCYGNEIAKSFKTLTQSDNAEIYFYEPDGVSDEFLEDLWEKLEEGQFNALYIPDSDRKTLTLISKLKFKGLNLQETLVIGSSDWNKPLFTSDHSLKGALFPQTKLSASESFVEEYQKNFGTQPNMFAELSYDLVTMLNTINQGHNNMCFGKKEITDKNGFRGTRGNFYFNDDGLIRRNYAFMEITGGSPKKLREESSPESIIAEKYRDLFDDN